MTTILVIVGSTFLSLSVALVVLVIPGMNRKLELEIQKLSKEVEFFIGRSEDLKVIRKGFLRLKREIVYEPFRRIVKITKRRDV